MNSPYKFKCLQCGQRFKSTRYLARHQRNVHQKQAKIKKYLEKQQAQSKHLQQKLPGKGINILALIIFVIIVIAFIYFVYLR